MTLLELSAEYRSHALVLEERVVQLQGQLAACREKRERQALERRIHLLRSMLRDTRELANLTEHYYDRGYHRNERYTL